MRAVLLIPFLFLMAGCASTPPKEAVADLAPNGTLRAAINVGNAVLAARGTPEPTGVSVDLAKELARRLGVRVHLIVFDAAGKVVEAGKTGDWDIAFVALDPKRAAEIAQSPPYVQIEGAYLVRSDSKLTANEQVDAKGHRIVVGRNSAYDLYLTRELKQAELGAHAHFRHGNRHLHQGKLRSRRRREAAARGGCEARARACACCPGASW